MDIKIDKEGILYILRKTKWIKQECPFKKNDYQMHNINSCNDKCPLFFIRYENELKTVPATQKIILQLCHNKKYDIDKLIDEREE